MIEVSNISKKFSKRVTRSVKKDFYADREISFEAHKGEILGIIGPNGAGKTTLLRIIAGIMKPTSGKVEIDRLRFDLNEVNIKKQMAFLSGNTKLYKDLSGYELLQMCGEYYGLDKQTIENRIKEVITSFDLKDFINERIEHLSTGQTQRISLARCVIHNPNIYILDEATSGLDVVLSQIVLNFIKEEKKKGKCILYSTHYMEEAENICDRVVILNKGKVVSIGTPEEIKKQTKTDNLRDAFFNLIGGNHA